MFPLFSRVLLMLMMMDLSKKVVWTNLQGSQQNFDPSEYIFQRGPMKNLRFQIPTIFSCGEVQNTHEHETSSPNPLVQ